ncbi:hypothetical protein ABMB67_003166 [Halalkalibacter oceani]
MKATEARKLSIENRRKLASTQAKEVIAKIHRDIGE